MPQRSYKSPFSSYNLPLPCLTLLQGEMTLQTCTDIKRLYGTIWHMQVTARTHCRTCKKGVDTYIHVHKQRWFCHVTLLNILLQAAS